MDILAWLRKLGHKSYAAGLRDGTIGLEFLHKLRSPDREVAPEDSGLLLNAVAVPKERPARSRDSSPGPWRRPGPVPGPAKAPQLVLVSQAGARRRQQRPAPLVGRTAEYRVLLRAWRSAARGQGRVVLLSGAAGIGKSRIVRELCGRRAGDPHTALWHRCSPEHAASPLRPLVALLQPSAGPPKERPEERLARLETLLAESGEGIGHPAMAAVAVADLLGIEVAERRAQLRLTPQRLRARTFEVLLARLEELARRQMVVWVCEDLHWADPSTLELLDRMVDRIASLPVLALVTFRPDFEPAWGDRAHVVPLALTPLGHGPCEAMIEHLAMGEALTAPVLEELIARSGGVPLLVEELTRAALEIADEAQADDVEPGKVAGAAPELSIPSALPEAVIARLDRSPEVAAIAGIGAVIGREFPHQLLAAVAGWPEDQLRAALDRLVDSALVVRHGAPPDTVYAFRHALIRDVAYRTLPEPARQSLHEAIAGMLEERWPEVAASAPELLAQHYAAAGQPEPAVDRWLLAGRRASERSAHAEAIALFSQGLELLDSLPPAPELAAARAELLAALAQALTRTKGAAAPEVEQACGLARTLCQSAPESPGLFPAARALWDHYNTRGEIETASELAEQCQRLASGAQDPRWSIEADFCLGVSLLFAGRLPEARDRLTRSVVHFEGQCRPDVALPGVRDPRIVALAHLAHALWLSGYPDQAVRAGQEAVAAARAAGHPFSLTYALLGASWVAQLGREAAASRALAAEAAALAGAEGFPAFLAMARILRDRNPLNAEAAARPAAAAGLDRALDDYRTAGAEIARPYLLGLLAEVHEAAGEIEPTLAVLAEAAEVARATGELWYEPEIRRREGELLLRQSITNRRVASARFCQAIAVAGQQGGRSLELRATVSLARLWSDLGRRTPARDLLAPVYGWFKEGFDTADLVEAKALLEQLS
jgi:predicted ATPase